MSIQRNDKIIDAHVHICGPPKEAEPENFVKLMNKSSIDKAIVFRYIYGQPTKVGNQIIYHATKKFPNHFIGFAWIDPNSESATDEVQEAVLDWQFKGIKIHLEMNAAPTQRIKKVLREAEKQAIPVCIHTSEDLTAIDKLADTCSVKIIIAHLGTGVYNLSPQRLRNAVDLAKRHENVYLETSGNTYFFVKYAVEELSAAKIIFGSDFPHEHPLVQLKIIDLLDLSSQNKALILASNILKLISPSCKNDS